MKIIAYSLLLFSSLVFAQPNSTIGANNQGNFQIKKDSFAMYKEKEGHYLSLTVEVIPKKSTKPVGYAHYKMLENDCNSESNFNLYRINDYDTEILSTHITKFNEQNLNSAIAGAICNYFEDVVQNPSINNNSIQNLLRYAQYAPDHEWSIPMVLGENKFLTLTNSIKFEEAYVSMITKFQYPAKTTDYYKIYIDRDFCRNKKGHFEMKTLDTVTSEMEDIPFDLNKIPNKDDIKAVHFHNIAKTMCEYTMKNFNFKKRINISELNKPDESTTTMFDRKP